MVTSHSKPFVTSRKTLYLPCLLTVAPLDSGRNIHSLIYLGTTASNSQSRVHSHNPSPLAKVNCQLLTKLIAEPMIMIREVATASVVARTLTVEVTLARRVVMARTVRTFVSVAYGIAVRFHSLKGHHSRV